MNATTEINEAIHESIVSCSAHELANELADAGVSVEQIGWPNSDDEACHIAGYGTVFVLHPGWVVRAFTDDLEYPISHTELAAELDEIIKMTQQLL